MSQNYLSNPKARVLAVAPKARWVKDWARGGRYTVYLGDNFQDFNGQVISSLATGTSNPSEAWYFVCEELRLV